MTQFLRDEGSDSEEVLTPLMLDGTYLSRNFATLGPFLTLQPPCLAPSIGSQVRSFSRSHRAPVGLSPHGSYPPYARHEGNEGKSRLLRSLKDSSLRYFLRSSVPSVSPRPSLSLHSPLRGREERTTEGVSDERSTRSGEGTGNIIIKTTYDISLDFQDSLLPLRFLSLSRIRSSSLTLRSFHSPRRAGE